MASALTLPQAISCRLLIVALLLAMLGGCRTRSGYRRWADAQSACLIDSRQTDPRWVLPDRPVTAAPDSRMADLSPPDCGPLPPDDPAAHAYMECPGCMRGWPCWHARGDLSSIEFSRWLQTLPTGDEGALELSQEDSIELALLHARDYQNEVESLYLNALTLTLERFEFSTRWFAGNDTFFDVIGTGGPPGESRSLRTASATGFEQNLAAGGQLLVEIANSFVWEFAGDTVSSASSGILLSLFQPLLRGAWREVRLEGLTQAERDLLYGVRDFARFRRIFYVDVMGSNGYLGLLAIAQAVKNEEKNVEALERNLREHEQLGRAGLVAPIQIDQVFQQYQQGRLNLMAANQALQRALDQFKVRLGLPPTLQVQLDEEALKPFELNNPELEELQARNEELRLSLLQDDQLSQAHVERAVSQLKDQRADLRALMDEVREDLKTWRSRLDTADPADQANRAETLEREVALADRLATLLDDVVTQFDEDGPEIERLMQESLDDQAEGQHAQAREVLNDLVGRRFRKEAADLFVIQAQIRVHLIEITPVDLQTEAAVRLALQNRLDLMNSRGNVVDAYRRVEVAADGLEGDLNLRMEAELGTDPQRTNPIRFDASANRYRIGVEFDSPVTRLEERNVYRAQQIAYQRARRDFMETQDFIVAEVRDNLRNVQFDRFSFEIAKLQLLTAARQVDEAQLNLRSAAQASSNLTRDLLSALQGLLDSKNNLIRSWVSYETSRMALYRDLDLMDISPEGVWINEDEDLSLRDQAGQPGQFDQFGISGAAATGAAAEERPAPRDAEPALERLPAPLPQ